MAKPRVFLSSTYYDLKHIRSTLELFVEGLGFEPVLSEKGVVAFTPDSALDESCYREAENADIFVLIIGGRYGSEASAKRESKSLESLSRYESITKKEYESAVGRDVPIYVLVESNVHSEYQTYLRNRDNKEIEYAHVDSVNVFRFIEEILSKPRNNPMHTFERASEIENWLREQWAGYFRELLKRKTQDREIHALAGQVSELKAINETLRNYLEAVMQGITPDKSGALIESERRRLELMERNEKIKQNVLYEHISRGGNVSLEEFIEAVSKAKSGADFVSALNGNSRANVILHNSQARIDFNEARRLLGVDEINFPSFDRDDDDDFSF